jgi:hypothetical protein
VERRHNEHKRMQEIVLAYQKELNVWYQVETQKRENFFEFYGRYLPQSLCPSVMVPFSLPNDNELVLCVCRACAVVLYVSCVVY